MQRKLFVQWCFSYAIKGLSNLSELEPFNVMLNMISDIKEHWYDLWNTIVIAINYCNAKKMMRSLMCIISNHGIKCLSNLLHVEPSEVMFKVISDRMTHWYDLWNTILIAINFCNAKKTICELMFIISNHDGIKCLSKQLERCYVMLYSMWFLTLWHIGIISEIQLLLL